MSKLLDLVRDQRRQSTSQAQTVSYEVVDRDGNPIAASPRKGTTHYRVFTGVSEPEQSWSADEAAGSDRAQAHD
jgi:hypothetical protein